MAMDIDVLKAELVSDPLGVGYSAMSDEQAAVSLNDTGSGRTRAIQAVETWQLFEAISKAEYAVLTAEDKTLLQTILSMGMVNLQRPNLRSVLAGMFGPGSTTRSNLIALQTTPVSRATELGLPEVKVGNVQEARRV